MNREIYVDKLNEMVKGNLEQFLETRGLSGKLIICLAFMMLEVILEIFKNSVEFDYVLKEKNISVVNTLIHHLIIENLRDLNLNKEMIYTEEMKKEIILKFKEKLLKENIQIKSLFDNYSRALRGNKLSRF